MVAGGIAGGEGELFRSATWYDQTINWEARLGREIDVLAEVFGSPGDGGVIDAGCGPGRHACAMAARGYRVTGADISDEMLVVATEHATKMAEDVSFVACSYAELGDHVGSGHDGIFCIGNGLAVAGTQPDVAASIEGLCGTLRVGGKLFIQMLNFTLMHGENPCVRGPRVVTVDGVEYVSFRTYQFGQHVVEVVNTTLWHDSGWQMRSWSGRLIPIERYVLVNLLEACGMDVLHTWGSYAQEPFDIAESRDLIVVAEKRG